LFPEKDLGGAVLKEAVVGVLIVAATISRRRTVNLICTDLRMYGEDGDLDDNCMQFSFPQRCLQDSVCVHTANSKYSKGGDARRR
jgi:hypothetical protein